MNLLVYSKFTTPRLTFVCQQIFDIWLGLKCCITSDFEIYKRFEGIRLNYSSERIHDEELFLPASSLLKASSIEMIALNTLKYNKIPALFKIDVPSSSVPFDLFATVFFHLSRYEEYLPFQADEHKRFTYKKSWAYQQDCLHLPIVDQLVLVLEQLIKQQYPRVILRKRSFCFQPTYDIDMAWAYQHKGIVRTLGSLAKDIFKGNKKQLQEKWKVLVHNEIDPFYTFDFLHQLNQRYNILPVYFFLLGDYSKHDENISVQRQAFRQLIHRIADTYPTGIHPSYSSNSQSKKIKIEIQRLASVTHRTVTKSRQHFLKLHLPTTYRHLLNYGIKEDYSMGYAGQVGFRAGTSLPFYWYDLQQEKQTDLLIHPFQIMDVTLKDYLHLTPDQAKMRISKMIETIKAVNGTFCSLWHNSSFSTIGGWEDWKEVYVHLIKEGKERAFKEIS